MTKYDKYASPTELLLDKDLSFDEKTELLVLWCDDEEALMRAASEGMGGGERPQLKQVQQALKTHLATQS